ncbi:MAG: polysaccharide biosynthesis protein, partial [Butyrivibrio sp.]|nr:polysaccharide biosynthesis protein [Butyrivibrio sp.]
VMTYFLFAYRTSLISAFQRKDIEHIFSIITNTLLYIIQAVVIVVLRNYYYYASIVIFIAIIYNLLSALYTIKVYPKYKPEGKLAKEEVQKINSNIKDLFFVKLASAVNLSADTIVISAFLGITVLARYQNYYYIMQAMTIIISVILNACTAGIGNSLILETKEKNYNDIKKLTFLIMWIVIVFSTGLICDYQPFIKIWVGQENILPYGIVISLCIYFIFMEIQKIMSVYKDAAGLWKPDRFRPLICALVNLTLNIASVKYVGLYGIIFSTVITFALIDIPWGWKVLFNGVFNNAMLKEYIGKIFIYFVCAISSWGIGYILTFKIEINPVADFVIKGLIAVLVSNFILWLVLNKTREYKENKVVVKKLLLKFRR